MSYTTNSCYDCCLRYPSYNCIYTPYNDPTFYEALASSGELSLGTAAGTDRSISGEFGGSAPHGLSEYYSCASGIPSSGAIDFSDFYGKSAWDNPVQNCVWTHYDFSECSTGVIDKWGTTGNATECQCMRGYYISCCYNTSGNCGYCIKAVGDGVCTGMTCICEGNACFYNGKNYLMMQDAVGCANYSHPDCPEDCRRHIPFAMTMHGDATWMRCCYGTGTRYISGPCSANTVFIVFGGTGFCIQSSYYAVANGNWPGTYVSPFTRTGFAQRPHCMENGGGNGFYLCLLDSAATGRCGCVSADESGANPLEGLLRGAVTGYSMTMFDKPLLANGDFRCTVLIGAQGDRTSSENYASRTLTSYYYNPTYYNPHLTYTRMHCNPSCAHQTNWSLGTHTGPIILGLKVCGCEWQCFPGSLVTAHGKSWYDGSSWSTTMPSGGGGYEYIFSTESNGNYNQKSTCYTVLDCSDCHLVNGGYSGTSSGSVYSTGTQRFAECIDTAIPCGGMDVWNNPANMLDLFNNTSPNAVTGQLRWMSIGEYIHYNCVLTDTEACQVLQYLHDKWQGACYSCTS